MNALSRCLLAGLLLALSSPAWAVCVVKDAKLECTPDGGTAAAGGANLTIVGNAENLKAIQDWTAAIGTQPNAKSRAQLEAVRASLEGLRQALEDDRAAVEGQHKQGQIEAEAYNRLMVNYRLGLADYRKGIATYRGLAAAAR